MSRDKLFIIVEGRRYDPVFYDRLCAAAPDLVAAGYVIRSIDTIDMPTGARQRGKHGVLDLFRMLRRDGKLAQVTRSGTSSVVFIVDRDMDDFTWKKIRSPHVIYTKARDIEAEIHLRGDTVHALSTALSATKQEAYALSLALGDYVSDLADLWREWIELGALALAIDARCRVRPGGPSEIHAPSFGPLDAAAKASALADVLGGASSRANVAFWQRMAPAQIANVYRRSKQHLQVKGKWLPSFVEFRVKAAAGAAGFDYQHFGSNFTHSLLDSVAFDDSWADYYLVRIRALL